MTKVVNYVRASIEEMKKVTWPTKKELINYTILVIGISLLSSFFLGVVADFSLNKILGIIIKK